MTNEAVAAVFLEMGDLLAIQGGDPHRARAFRRTAQVIEGLRTPLAELLLLRRLERVQGIGKGSLERISEILATGTCAEHQRLLRHLPGGLRDLLRVRGLGARHVRLVFEPLGVSNLEQLEWAAKNGLLQRIPGLGDKTVERILRHLDEMRADPSPRLMLADALLLGAALVEHMRDEPQVVFVEQTGSARRCKDVIGDLDVLIATHHPRPCVRRFVSFPGVKDVLLAGDARASVVLENGVQADLRAVEPTCIGAGLHYFTGSKQHNIQIRLRANERYLAVSEKGVWERKLAGRGRGEENRKIARLIAAGRTEEEIFAAVGLPFIPPELREGDGEVEAAAAGHLPVLVDEDDLRGDLHLRASSLLEAAPLVQQARSMGLSYVAVVVPAAHLKEGASALRQGLQQLQQRHGLRIILGAEAILDDQGPALSPSARQHVELVIGVPPHDSGPEVAVRRMLEAIEAGTVDVISRPTGRVLPRDAAPEIDLFPVLRAAARRGVAIEVGGRPEWMDLDARWCRANREIGAQLSVASDAAQPENSRSFLRLALSQVRRGWVSPSLVLNARSPHEFEAWRTKRRGAAWASAPSSGPGGAWEELDSLSASLLADPLPAPLRERLQRFLAGADDPELAGVLTRSGNALQRAFEVIVRDQKR